VLPEKTSNAGDRARHGRERRVVTGQMGQFPEFSLAGLARPVCGMISLQSENQPCESPVICGGLRAQLSSRPTPANTGNQDDFNRAPR
jgi:hypothetical protein